MPEHPAISAYSQRIQAAIDAYEDPSRGPKRLYRQRTKGWRMPEGAVYVGRPSRWGNPFIVGPNEERGQVATAELAVEYYRDWMTHPERWSLPQPPSLSPLRGKNLVCWCSFDLPCHASVLLELANA